MKNSTSERMTVQKISLVILVLVVVWLSALLNPASGATLSGTITDSAGSVADIEVMVGRQYCTYNMCSISWSPSVVTGTDGKYTFSDLPAGEYTVAAPVNWATTPYILEYWENTYNLLEAATLSLAEDQTVQADFQLDLASTISGTVQRENGSALTAEEAANIQVIASFSSFAPCTYTAQYIGSVEEDGSYVIHGLPPGAYYVAARANGSVNYIPEWSGGATSVNQCDLAESVTISAPGSRISNIDFQLDSGATVQGTVYHSAQTSTDDIKIILRGGSAEEACFIPISGLQYEVSVQNDGSYVITGLSAGDYYSRAYHPDMTQEWLTGINTDSSPNCQTAEQLTVTTAEPNKIFEQRNFQLGEGGNISGIVFEAGGQTAADDGYVVRFHESCATTGDEAESSTSTGRYTSPVLPAGDYYLSLLNEDKSERIGWRTATGSAADSCEDAVPVHIEEDVTTSGIDFILKIKTILLPILFLLLGK